MKTFCKNCNKRILGYKAPEVCEECIVMPLKSEELLADFSAFCIDHPELRFWQALSVWSEKDIFAGKTSDNLDNTFYWNKK